MALRVRNPQRRHPPDLFPTGFHPGRRSRCLEALDIALSEIPADLRTKAVYCGSQSDVCGSDWTLFSPLTATHDISDLTW